MVMGIVICMAKRESVNIHSISNTSNPMASVSNTAIKRKNAVTTDAPTMPSGMASASVMVQSAIAQSLVVHAIVSGAEVQISLQVSFVGKS
jgi:hypothetical protein